MPALPFPPIRISRSLSLPLSLPLSLSLLLLSLFSAAVAVPQQEDQSPPVIFSDTARCYSCMSRLYEAVWPSLRFLYKPPKNFTDACDDISSLGDSVPLVQCPTICVSMAEEPNIAGVRVRGHIRGCLSEVLINGFNQTIVSWYRWMHRDSCRLYRKKELFKLPGDYNDDSMIEVCTCYADHCNGNSAAPSSFNPLTPILVMFILLLRL